MHDIQREREIWAELERHQRETVREVFRLVGRAMVVPACMLVGAILGVSFWL